MLCCCRCFRRRKVYRGPFPDDAEKGPIVVEQVIDDDPTPTSTIFGRQIAHMESIPEASPRPSDDLVDRAAIPTKPAAMPTAEEETPASPVQRSLSPSQQAGPSARVPTIPPTETSLLPPNTSVVARLQKSPSVYVPPTSTPPFQSSTPTPPINTPTPPPPNLSPPVPEPTPSPALTPGSTVIPCSRSPLRTPPNNVPAPPDTQLPKIEGESGPAPPQPSLLTRIKTLFLPTPSSEDEKGAAMTDGTGDRQVLAPRVAVRLAQKRVTKATVPVWSTEVWL